MFVFFCIACKNTITCSVHEIWKSPIHCTHIIHIMCTGWFRVSPSSHISIESSEPGFCTGIMSVSELYGVFHREYPFNMHRNPGIGQIPVREPCPRPNICPTVMCVDIQASQCTKVFQTEGKPSTFSSKMSIVDRRSF